MLLFRGSEVYQPDQSPEALETLTLKMMDWVGDLIEKGLHVASEHLQRTGKQVNGTSKALMDSPFGEAKDVIGGCTIVLANNVDEAVEIAKACPILASNANIEVRPMQSV